MHKEIINTIGTIATIVALVMAVVIGSIALKVLAGIGIVYTMYFHDEYLKAIWGAGQKKSNNAVEEE